MRCKVKMYYQCQKCEKITANPEDFWGFWKTDHKGADSWRPNHNWEEWQRVDGNNCKMMRVCKDCPAKENEVPDSHDWGEWISYTVPYRQTRQCQRKKCGRIEERIDEELEADIRKIKRGGE